MLQEALVFYKHLFFRSSCPEKPVKINSSTVFTRSNRCRRYKTQPSAPPSFYTESNTFAFIWIYFCWSRKTVNFILPFITNLTISISQIYLSRVAAIFQFRSPMAYLSHNLHDTGLLLVWMIYFEGDATFK